LKIKSDFAVPYEKILMIQMMRVVSLINEGHGSAHRKVCSWCNRMIREGGEPVSHGICPDCAEREMDRFLGAKSLKREEEVPGFSTRLKLFNGFNDSYGEGRFLSRRKGVGREKFERRNKNKD
jgi:hypothetical protein